MIHNKVIIVAFNAGLSDGCDYAVQTLNILGKKNVVFGLLLGEPVTWKDAFRLFRDRPVVARGFNSLLIRPFILVPGQRFFIIKQLNYLLAALVLRLILAFRYPKKRKILWFFEPWNMLPVFRVCAGYTRLYDCVDYFQQLEYESPSREVSLARRADVMTCTSSALAKAYSHIRNDIAVVPLGFSVPGEADYNRAMKRGAFVVGYIGGINYRLDYSLIISVARELHDIRFVFVGPVQYGLIGNEQHFTRSVRKLFALENVTYFPDVPKSGIGSYLQTFDIGIIPYDEQYLFNRYSFPMKVLDYFWYGLPVLSTRIEALEGYRDLVVVPGSAKKWVSAIRTLQNRRWSAHKQNLQKQTALEHVWKKKLEAISVELVKHGA